MRNSIDWIYESSDKGKTITKRVLGVHEAEQLGRQIMVAPNVWWSIDSLTELAKELHTQQCLRLENPILQELWNEYYAMLKLIQNS